MTHQYRYDIIAMTEKPATEQYGEIISLNSSHTIMGRRAYIESAERLATDSVDRKDSPYVYAFIRDRRDGMIVYECHQID
jgi:hypothetical protein